MNDLYADDRDAEWSQRQPSPDNFIYRTGLITPEFRCDRALWQMINELYAVARLARVETRRTRDRAAGLDPNRCTCWGKQDHHDGSHAVSYCPNDPTSRFYRYYVRGR